MPDGAVPGGPFDGFDFATSGGGLRFFVVPKTPGFTNEDPVSVGETIRPMSWGETKGRYR